jgi:hypothetical protein
MPFCFSPFSVIGPTSQPRSRKEKAQPMLKQSFTVVLFLALASATSLTNLTWSSSPTTALSAECQKQYLDAQVGLQE